MNTEWWLQDLPKELVDLQVDISCLVDGELDEVAACRVMEQLEQHPSCKEFFEDCLLQVRLHRDMSDPGQLLERFSALTGKEPEQDAASFELVHQLATIFYKIAKAYVLSGMDPEYRIKVFEKAVEVESTKRWGRGFVDGVLSRGGVDDVDLQHARHMLNGKLSRIEGAAEKGKRLLDEALAIDPDHEEARLYRAFVNVQEGRTLRAEKEFRQVFDTALDEVNRGHAAVQLAMLYFAENEYRKAIGYLRWLLVSGLEARDVRFYVVRFNLGVYYAHWRKPERALQYFRELLDHHPDRVQDISELFLQAPTLRPVIESQPGFSAALLDTCPELFGVSPSDDGGLSGPPFQDGGQSSWPPSDVGGQEDS